MRNWSGLHLEISTLASKARLREFRGRTISYINIWSKSRKSLPSKSHNFPSRSKLYPPRIATSSSRRANYYRKLPRSKMVDKQLKQMEAPTKCSRVNRKCGRSNSDVLMSAVLSSDKTSPCSLKRTTSLSSRSNCCKMAYKTEIWRLRAYRCSHQQPVNSVAWSKTLTKRRLTPILLSCASKMSFWCARIRKASPSLRNLNNC